MIPANDQRKVLHYLRKDIIHLSTSPTLPTHITPHKMSADTNSRTVFIGNIPYGLTEEQIVQIASSVGQVLNFRLVYDTDTGRPKGFGFAEFADSDAAASAVRNLDKYQIQGRELRVDFSHVGGKDDNIPANFQPMSQPPANGFNGPPPPNAVGPLPPGVPLLPGLTCPDAISKTLSTLPPPQLLDILSQFKGLVMGDPMRATELLKQAPQLSFAMFQALLLMGLVDSSLIASVVDQAAGSDAAPTEIPQRQAAPPPPTLFQGYGSGNVPTPPSRQQPYQPPQQQQAPQPPMPAGHEDLLKQVLNMPQHEVDKLAPNERAQIMSLKQQYGGRIGY